MSFIIAMQSYYLLTVLMNEVISFSLYFYLPFIFQLDLLQMNQK
jgi:hypothetical protein